MKRTVITICLIPIIAFGALSERDQKIFNQIEQHKSAEGKSELAEDGSRAREPEKDSVGATKDKGGSTGYQLTPYVVQRGDYSSRIAKKFNVRLSAMLKANPDVDFDKLRPGQTIWLPCKPEAGPELSAVPSDPRAQLELGRRMIGEKMKALRAAGHMGEFSPECAEGIEWIEKSAAQGCAEAWEELIRSKMRGPGVKQDLPGAIALMKRRIESTADLGERRKLMSQLGLIYYCGLGEIGGEGIPREPAAAAECFNECSCAGLGMMLLSGDGMKQDVPRALELLRKTDDDNTSIREHRYLAQLILAVYYRQGIDAACVLIEANREGMKEVIRKNLLMALDGQKREKGAAQSFAVKMNSAANRELGLCHYLGLGLGGSGNSTNDFECAAQCFQTAAYIGDAGEEDAEAKYWLGMCYLEGKGKTTDLKEAVDCFRKAAAENERRGNLQLGLCYAKGIGVEVDKVEAVKNFLEAAESSDRETKARACFELGYLYCNDVEGTHDYAKATDWYSKAAEAGFEKAKDGIERIKHTPGATTEYVVSKGDTYGAIAYRHGTSIRVLRIMNGLQTNDSIRVGQKLVVPVANAD